MGIEDSAVIAALLEAAQDRVQQSASSPGPAVTKAAAIEAAFGAFDTSRRARSQWLVQSSRFCSMVCQSRGEARDWDTERKRAELEARARIIWDFDAKDAVRDAVADLGRRLGDL